MKSKIELIRAVKSPEGDSIDDKRGKKPERSLYMQKPTCMEKVKKSRVLERTFNQK